MTILLPPLMNCSAVGWTPGYNWSSSYVTTTGTWGAFVPLMLDALKQLQRAAVGVDERMGCRIEKSAQMSLRSGRPRLDHRPGFAESFAAILPRLQAMEISQREAAEELGISPRSLMRYAEQAEEKAKPGGAEPMCR